MKTAEEIFKKWNTSADIGEGLDIVEFSDAIAERDQEWRSRIEKKTKPSVTDYHDVYNQALKELLEEGK